MTRVRLDLLIVARGLAPTRERARALILGGHALVDDAPASKAGTLVREDARVSLKQPDHPWVGRGGLKLAHALEHFEIDPTGFVALDIGASTGGFTDVLLQHGAARVVALDVGQNQLDWRLRSDPRVVTIEGVNARYLTPDQLPADLRLFDLVTIDVSFISLRLILPVVPPLLRASGRVIALVKPQFEAGRDEVGAGGIVRDTATHARVVEEVAAAVHRIGLKPLAVQPSPITGAEGNQEFLMLIAQAAPSA